MSVRPGEKPCPRCGGGVDTDAFFCGRCGRYMPSGQTAAELRVRAELATMLCNGGREHQRIALGRTHHSYCTVCGEAFNQKMTERKVVC